MRLTTASFGATCEKPFLLLKREIRSLRVKAHLDISPEGQWFALCITDIAGLRIEYYYCSYDAGYYGYLYSLVFSMDMYETVFAKDPMSKEAGKYSHVELGAVSH